MRDWGYYKWELAKALVFGGGLVLASLTFSALSDRHSLPWWIRIWGSIFYFFLAVLFSLNVERRERRRRERGRS